MSVNKRWVLAGVAGVLWVAWVWCASAHRHDPHMQLLSDSLRVLFVVAAVSLVLACLVTPMSAVLHVGRQIGRAEQRRDCGCRVDHSDAPRPMSRVLEFKSPRQF